MTYQLIVSTMNQTDDSLIEKMNINSDAIIINQTNHFSYHEIYKNEYTIKWYDLNEKGVGLSRNTGLMRADADIIQFADDDMVLSDTYRKDVINEYSKRPKADIILFSNKCLNKDKMPYKVSKFGRVNRIEGVRFGGARISARREKLLYNNISFSLLFGGGARYCAGEDVTFVQDCIKTGLKVYKSPIIISVMKQDTSTWFKGYNEKYFRDKGSLLAANFPLICKLGVYIQAYKGTKRSDFSYKKLVTLYKEGIKEYLERK